MKMRLSKFLESKLTANHPIYEDNLKSKEDGETKNSLSFFCSDYNKEKLPIEELNLRAFINQN